MKDDFRNEFLDVVEWVVQDAIDETVQDSIIESIQGFQEDITVKDRAYLLLQDKKADIDYVRLSEQRKF